MLELPKHCPCCGSTLERVNDQLFCRNKDCDAQTSKSLEFFVKTIGVKGLGEKTLERLNISSINELFELSKDDYIERLGNAIGSKVFEQLEQAKEHTQLDLLLAAFSIPLIGKATASKLCSVVSYVDEISAETCKQAGLGAKATESLLDWLTDKYPLYENLPFSFRMLASTAKTLEAKGVVVITGKLTNGMTRNEAKALLLNQGFDVKESISSKTNYLLCEEESSSSKTKKAEQLGIPVVTLNYLLSI